VVVNIAVQRCATGRFGPLQGNQISGISRSSEDKETLDEQRQKAVSDRGHSR
jgi:hypothetical protein